MGVGTCAPRSDCGSGAGARREPWRPDREDLRLLSLMAQGLTIEAVAREVGMSVRTVRRRVRAVGEHLGVETTMESVVWAVRAGLI
ncbi:helix-turn-helix domain-containing protein [Nocardioides bruguierae]|uniref:Helix-turn-helix domain-containing protein n=1 Tax=Nocardioides bruguierae TaxID=2945102 RepID=A0A9X2D772_9ACTN|nr:helix-turn-helix domain-containing protein [Nocardioides bruguierae]MCM0620653.1 helix-turn-helix domain-containing protein [Nocardioides bruguierae]